MAKKRPRGSPPEALVSVIGDAVDAGILVSNSADIAIYSTAKTKSALSPVFAAALEAVAGEGPGKITQRVFGAASNAAAKAMEDAALPIDYEVMADGVLGIPDQAIWVAARQAAGDLFHRLPAKERKRRGERLLKKARKAAVMAARVRLGRDKDRKFRGYTNKASDYLGEDKTAEFQAAVKSSQDIAERIVGVMTMTVYTGVVVHAAAVAAFGAAIRGVPRAELAGAVEKACEDLTAVARREDEVTGRVVSSLAVAIYVNAARRRKAGAAVRGAEKLLRDATATQITDVIYASTFEAAYEAVAACAYAVSSKSAFKAGYEPALAKACGVKLPESSDAIVRDMLEGHGGDAGYAGPEEFLRELHQRLYGAAEREPDPEGETRQQSVFPAASEVDYEAAASDDGMEAIISLYKAAYRAGARAAKSVMS